MAQYTKDGNQHIREILDHSLYDRRKRTESFQDDTLDFFQQCGQGPEVTNMWTPGAMPSGQDFVVECITIHVFDVSKDTLRPLVVEMQVGPKRYFTHVVQLMDMVDEVLPWGEERKVFHEVINPTIMLLSAMPFRVRVSGVPVGGSVGVVLRGKLIRSLQ